MTQELTGLFKHTERQSAKIYSIYQNENPTASSADRASYVPNTEPGIIPTVRPHRKQLGEVAFKIIEPSDRKYLQDAFYKIVEANDYDLQPAERSNCFDEWKDLMEIIARNVENITNNHRKILGALIASTHEYDISDFDVNSLKILQEATNVLRQPRISKQESLKVLSDLRKQNLKITLPLAVDYLDENSINGLNDMMEKLIKESRTTQ